jgi:hypothetical protein
MPNPTWLFLSLVLGTIGAGLFLYGRKADRLPHLAAGLVLMVYPYFVGTTLVLLIVGGAIGAGLWLVLLMGY